MPFQKSAFVREALPLPANFYKSEFPRLRRASRGWALAHCPFHKERTPSFSVHLSSGGFNCFACGVKGGDIIDFLMLRDKVDFKTAAKSLGAWSEVSQGDLARIERDRRERLRAAEIEARKEREILRSRIETRNHLHTLERVYRSSSKRLTELRRGQPEKYPGEEDVMFEIMAGALPQIRFAAADYAELAGVGDGE